MKLVFIKSKDLNEEPYTTSKIIAEYGNVNHDTVQRLIRNYSKDLKEFGVIGFEIRKLQNSNGGRPEKIYKLNEQQAMLLITYMQNTLPVRNFKKELVKQFYEMKEELTKRRIERNKDKEQRNVLTDAIDGLPDSPHKIFKYRHYTDLIYKTLFNRSSKELKLQFGVEKNGKIKDYFTEIQLSKISKLEQQVASLIDLGLEYREIKAILERRKLANNMLKENISISN